MGSRPSKSATSVRSSSVRDFDSSLSSINSNERSKTPMIVIDSYDKSPRKKVRQKENNNSQTQSNSNRKKIERAQSSTSTASSSSFLGMPSSHSDIAIERFQTGYPTILGRCFHCGEPGHFVTQCNHQQPVKCKSCGLKGHKKEYCKTYRKLL